MLSILIPTAGRGEVLPVVLESASRESQSVAHPTEIVVIDNNSNEKLTRCIRQQCNSANSRVRYIREPSPGLTAARHRGADEAAGELLVFLDDDVELGQGWLAGVLEGFSDSNVGIVGGPSIPRFGGSVPAWFWDFVTPTPYGGWHCTWLSLLDIGQAVDDIHPNYVWGLNFGIRRSVLGELGGFHPDLVPSHLQRWQGDGETGLTMKAKADGVRARYVPQALLYHLVGPDRLTLDYFSRRARYQGVCDSFTQLRAGSAFADALPNSPVPTAANVARPWEVAAAEVYRRTAQAYREGFEFHQREAANDPRLMQWIRRDSYWGADILAEAKTINENA